nr:plasmid stabilization protein [uncultured Rhodopila sp.]
MTTLVIRNVEQELHGRPKAQAAARGRSMEEEARIILRRGISASPSANFSQAMRALFEPLGGFERPYPDHEAPRDAPDFAGLEWDQPP